MGMSVRAVIQRVSNANVTVGGRSIARIGRGLLVLLGVGQDDISKDVTYLVGKTAGLRVFEGSDGRMTESVRDISGEILAVPQFTLYGDVRRGLRPNFDAACLPGRAEALYREYVARLRADGLAVKTGLFRETMRVDLTNEGPVTIILDSAKLF